MSIFVRKLQKGKQTIMYKKNHQFLQLPKKYLVQVGFVLNEPRAHFVKRLFSDTLAAAIYSITSIVLIMIQKADLVVLALNILCLFRATMHNTICATKITDKSQSVGIDKQKCAKYYYHIKAAVLASTFFFDTLVFCIILYDKTFNISDASPQNNFTLFIKIFASIPIILVLCNDIENNLICAYDATINPII